MGLAVALLGSCARQFGQQAAGPAHYAGKTIEIIVPFKEGGGTDIYARFVAPFLEKHIQGNPKVVVKNMPGGESIIGANWFAANAKPDGLLMLATSTSTVIPFLLGRAEVKYDFGKMKPVMVTSAGACIYASPSVVSSVEQLESPAKPLVYGGISATGQDLIPILAFELLGLDVKCVLGFEGRGPARLAFERGETNIDMQTTMAYLSNVVPLVKEGKAVPLMTFGAPKAGSLERDPVLKDIPTVAEAYERLHGKPPSGPAWEAYLAFASADSYQKMLWVTADTPAEIVQILESAVEKMISDPDFQSKGKEVTGGYPTYVGKDVEKAVRQNWALRDDVRRWVIELLTSKYKVKF